jgi:D-serine deaminase-like pyridoxal phosphate-dependent protein
MTDEALHRPLVGVPGGRARLNTPVLLVDLPALDRNIARMAAFAAAVGLKLRPHSKTHKSPDIARRQIAAGAVGQCCAKLGEAEALAAHGVREGLLITSPVVGPAAIARLAALNGEVEGLMCVVDHPDNARALGAAAQAAGRPLQVLIDIDPGLHRTGVTSAATAVALWRVIAGSPGLIYAGIQYYCGSHQHIPALADRQTAMEERADYLRSVLDALTAEGGAPAIVTGGGTGTHRIDATLGVFTELQVGSYVFMDRQYLDCEFGLDDPYETALMVEARVVSANSPGLVTLDAGLKAFATEAGAPVVLAGAPDGCFYRFMGDEHGALILKDGRPLPGLGSLVTLGAPHCDPTVNLYDTYHVIAGDMVVDLWPVAGRGRSR